MTRLIVEKGTGFTTGAHLQDLIRELQRFASGNPALLEAIMSSKTAVSTVAVDGDSSGGPTSFVSTGADFDTDVVVEGDYVTILKSDEEANIGTWRVVSRTNQTTLVLDATLVSDTGMTFTVDRTRHARHSQADINIFVLP